MTLSVLIVCLGNICRSPMGEAVLKHEAEKRGIVIKVDSAGTGAYHLGKDPDERTVKTCKEHNVPINHSARQVQQSDFKDFQYILAADESNLRNLEAIRPRSATAQLRLWGSYLDNKPIPDPYYGGITGFQRCFEQCTNLSNAFLDEVVGK
ncbi:phosphotyrosine protein phosphatase I superfamily [Pisolithus orientalis]|uniref:phosphotyrosine protein phosphatase I superfamily n=1 Tax=Pisolithus orientalis TaxID=936130 RepID=UPI0022251031|nr:phosphotyrosine protein phosphatase I superfamily [Pisolithus orientalis]KAI6008307.1 phosphotyrosine protein phosphatase I superfamily [Pisolithus orientalis]